MSTLVFFVCYLSGPSIHGAQQKSRRFSAKESSVLSKRIDGAKRKQSIYSQILLNCYAVGGSNAGPKHSKIIVFPLGFREAFSLLPSCLCGFIWSNTVELGGFGKDTWFFDEMQSPYEDTEQPYFFMTDDNGDIQEWFPWYLPPMYNEVANPMNAVWNGSIGCLLF